MWFLKLLAMAASIAMIKYRERIGENIGEAEWMRYVGGVYNLVILVAIFVFFWSLASLTGTQKFFFYPLYMLMGGAFE